MSDTPRPTNPFGSATTRPGALPYYWTAAQASVGSATIPPQTKALAEELKRLGTAAIVGPHGAGKSTLLCDLESLLQSEATSPQPEQQPQPDNQPQPEQQHQPDNQPQPSRQIVRCVLHERATAKPVLQSAASLHADDWLIVDGYEQLSWLAQLRLRSTCKRQHVHLLVTTHAAPRGFPVLAHLATDRQRAEALAKMLLEEYPELTQPLLAAFADHWLACGGNLRILWSHMYDSFEEELTR